MVCALLSIFLAGAALAIYLTGHLGAQGAYRRARAGEITASLAQGVAWIWPDSNGPHKDAGGNALPYREAAVLVESFVLHATSIERGGRTQPLALPAGVRIIPLIHIEAAADATAELTAAQRDTIVAAVRRQASAALASGGMLQLDFEAPARQRAAYRALIAQVREVLPAKLRLSITVLAHWCFQGDWLDRLPVDEVVPMLYRLGPNADGWLHRFAQDDSGMAQRCRGPAMGFATNAPPPSALLARAARPYWFDEAAWANPSRPPRYLGP